MDKTSSSCSKSSFETFCVETQVEEDNFDLADFDEIFSEDDNDFRPERASYHHAEKIVSFSVGTPSDFTPADVDLLNRLIDSQFSPARTLPDILISTSDQELATAAPPDPPAVTKPLQKGKSKSPVNEKPAENHQNSSKPIKNPSKTHQNPIKTHQNPIQAAGKNAHQESAPEEPASRPPLWTKTGDRISRHPGLRFVVKSPKTMQFLFFQKKTRHVLTALRTFFLFSEQSTRMKLRILSIPGVVRRLVQIIVYQAGLPQRLAIMLLGSLSDTNIFPRLFIGARGLGKLEPIFRSSQNAEVNVWLTLLMRNLSQSKVIQRQFLEMLLLDVMLDMVAVKDQDPDVVKNLLQTLYFLCRNQTIRTFLVVRGSFTAIGELLWSPYRYIQYLTLRLLLKLLHSKSGKPIYRFDKSGGLASLTNFLGDITQRKFFPLCIELLEYILLAPAVARKAVEKGLYRVLMELAMDRRYENIDSVQEFALKTVTRVAEIGKERRTMQELGYEAKILFFLENNQGKVQVAALQAIAGLCRRPSCTELTAHRIIRLIMEGAHSDVREWAFYAIAFLMFRNEIVMASLVEKGLGGVIYETLLSERETWATKGNALLCAILLRKNQKIRQRLRVSISESIPSWLLNANKRIRNYAAVSIGIFVTDQETRGHFATCKGYRALSMACTMSQMRSKERPELELIRNLCFGLATLAVDKETVWALINAESLTPLWLLKQESDRVSQGYVGLTLHRLVALDPFFRYSLLGKLDSVNKLPHGLHDQGAISLSNPLRQVEYFLKQGLMADRTVIYVSLPKKYWKRPQTPESCSYRAPKDGLDFLCDQEDGICPAEPAAWNKPMALERLERSLPPQDFWTYASYNPNVPKDKQLGGLLKQARKSTLNMRSVPEKVKALADMVVDRMGGPVESRTLHNWNDCVDVGLSFLKRKTNSNCVPIGAIEQGSSLHRALLFKILADVTDTPVSLVRGEGANLGWIETENSDTNCNADTKNPELFLVDLMHHPGELLAKSSSLAKQYTLAPELPQANGTVAARPSYSSRDIRPLRGVMSEARHQLLQSYGPHHSTERPIQVMSGRKKQRLFS